MQIPIEIVKRRIARARSAIGLGVMYRLGHGGIRPSVSTPTTTSACDCSGFVSWVLEMSRKPKITRLWWIETTNIYRDAIGPQKVFVRLNQPLVGCIVVYPDTGQKQGHVAIVSGYDGATLTIIDCASRTPAITERNGDFMRSRGAIFCTLKQDVK